MGPRVDASITLDDFRALGRALYRRAKRTPSRRASVQGFRLALALCWVTIAGLVFAMYRQGGIATTLGLILAGAVGASLILVFARLQRELEPEVDGVVLGSRTVLLSELGIEEATQHITSVTSWSAVLDLEETESHIFFVLDRAVMLVVPTRCFASAGHLRDFREFASRHISARLKG